jgi:two-component system phosphate regulon sensor histidine kinase PhoR
MKKTIFLKLFGTYVLIILALSTLVTLFSFSRIRSHYEDTLASELESLGRALIISVRPKIEPGPAADLDAFVKRTGRDVRARITVIDLEGKVLGDTEADPATMENHRYRPEFQEALAGRAGRSRRYSETLGANMLYVGLPIESSGRILGALRVSIFLRAIDILLYGLRGSLLGWILLVAAVSLGLAFLISVRATRSLGRLADASRGMAEGRFETRVVLGHRNDFRIVGDAFNSMAARIQALFAEVSGKKDELDRIVSSLKQGLVVADAESRIVLVNDRFREIFGEPALEGRYVWEIVRNPRIQEFVGQTLLTRQPSTAEIEIGEKTFQSTVAAMKEHGGFLITLNDITPVKRTERMKKDFIINASHELRTPLTAIQGAVETLDEDATGPNRVVLDILKRQVDRLRNIVEDLLDLAVAEDRAVALDLVDVDVRGLAEKAMDSFTARMRDKGIAWSVSAPHDLPRTQADPDLIDQILVNLIDNAVKYTDSGRVDVLLSAEGRELRLSVRDTGIGIAEEDLERIFERFYVIDKSRSRKSGGTGLGLSIVKHIAERHGGRVIVESVEGKGTTFTVSLPIRHAQG